ncbi:hypothetical protein ACYBOD_26610, partial [Klebsiella pneumoniae]|uniref:hypothetical protein n=1 Tax=Klebsiella pneumoniae TaxID=573 RepID=UPI001CBEFC8B
RSTSKTPLYTKSASWQHYQNLDCDLVTGSLTLAIRVCLAFTLQYHHLNQYVITKHQVFDNMPFHWICAYECGTEAIL